MLEVFLPAAGPGSFSGSIAAESGGTLSLENVSVTLGAPFPTPEVQGPTCQNSLYWCVMAEGGYLPSVQWGEGTTRRSGSASGTIVSSKLGRMTFTGFTANAWECPTC